MKADERNSIPENLRGKPLTAFEQQRSNAIHHRSISWELTFGQWWTIWQQSGKWLLRGRGTYKFCMCRIGDTGPYSIDNVFIASNAVNSSQATKKSELPIGVRANQHGKFYATKRVRNVLYRLGTFPTVDGARAAYENFSV